MMSSSTTVFRNQPFNDWTPFKQDRILNEDELLSELKIQVMISVYNKEIKRNRKSKWNKSNLQLIK